MSKKGLHLVTQTPKKRKVNVTAKKLVFVLLVMTVVLVELLLAEDTKEVVVKGGKGGESRAQRDYKKTLDKKASDAYMRDRASRTGGTDFNTADPKTKASVLKSEIKSARAEKKLRKKDLRQGRRNRMATTFRKFVFGDKLIISTD